MFSNTLLYVAARLKARESADDRGATMVEYGLLIGVIVVAILAGAIIFGDNIATWFSGNLSTRITSN